MLPHEKEEVRVDVKGKGRADSNALVDVPSVCQEQATESTHVPETEPPSHATARNRPLRNRTLLESVHLHLNGPPKSKASSQVESARTDSNIVRSGTTAPDSEGQTKNITTDCDVHTCPPVADDSRMSREDVLPGLPISVDDSLTHKSGTRMSMPEIMARTRLEERSNVQAGIVDASSSDLSTHLSSSMRSRLMNRLEDEKERLVRSNDPPVDIGPGEETNDGDVQASSLEAKLRLRARLAAAKRQAAATDNVDGTVVREKLLGARLRRRQQETV
jgi:hypothetical protein